MSSGECCLMFLTGWLHCFPCASMPQQPVTVNIVALHHGCWIVDCTTLTLASSAEMLACRDNAESLRELDDAQQSSLIQSLFLFSLVWSLGANTDEEGRCKFDAALRKLITGEPPAELAGEGLLSAAIAAWRHWV